MFMMIPEACTSARMFFMLLVILIADAMPRVGRRLSRSSFQRALFGKSFLDEHHRSHSRSFLPR